MKLKLYDKPETMKENQPGNNEHNVTNELKDIPNQINDFEQYLPINNLKLVGLPQLGQGETEEKVLINAFNNLNGIDIVVRPEYIDISNPLNTRRQNGKPVHIVKFISRTTIEAIVTAKKREANCKFVFLM